LTRLKGKERTEIPQVVLNRVLNKVCRPRDINPILQPHLITYWTVRRALQLLGYSRYFENTIKIIATMTGRSPVVLEDYQEQKLINLFRRIQEPFERNKANRKNFLSYSYVTYKFCEILGYTEFLPYLPLLKAPQNRITADKIWQGVCRDAGLRFIPTDPGQGAEALPPESEGRKKKEKARRRGAAARGTIAAALGASDSDGAEGAAESVDPLFFENTEENTEEDDDEGEEEEGEEEDC
jgi:hypothetical protein